MGNTTSKKKSSESDRYSCILLNDFLILISYLQILSLENLKQRLAPTTIIQVVNDDMESESECPICFNNYEHLNVSSCCRGNICTTCFIDLKALKSSKSSICPFCNTANYSVYYPKPSETSQMASPTKTISINSQATQFNSDRSSSLKSSTKSTPIVLASINDRKQLESEMMTQRKSFSVAHSYGSTSSHSSFLDTHGMMLASSPLSVISSHSYTGYGGSPRTQDRPVISSRDNPSLDDLLQNMLTSLQSSAAAATAATGMDGLPTSLEGYSDMEKLEQIMILQVTVIFLT
jgi:hypothetical protein